MPGKVEGPRLEIEAAGFDLGEIENFLDQRQQRLAGGLHGLGVGGLLGRERRVEQEIRHAENAVERRADFVADHREEARLGAIGVFGLVARLAQHVLGMHPIGDVAADALDFGLAADAQHDIAPGDPARAGGAVDFLVVHARAVRQRRGLALFDDLELMRAPDQLGARRAGERAIGVVGVSDMPVAAAPHDQVALRFEETARALLGFLHFPIAVGEFLGALFRRAQSRLQAAIAEEQIGDEGAGEREQAGDADREQMRIIAVLAGHHAKADADADRRAARSRAARASRYRAAMVFAPTMSSALIALLRSRSGSLMPAVILRGQCRRCAPCNSLQRAKFRTGRFRSGLMEG